MTIDDQSNGIVVNARLVFMVVFVLAHLAIASQVYLLSKDILSGDGSCEKLTVPLRYPPMRVPATPLTCRFAAAYHLCADFAQIYFPAQKRNALNDSYSPTMTQDPWHRESKYPPLVHVVCSNTLCYLPYGQASLVHLISQYALFLASLLYVCMRLNLKKYFFPMLLLINICLFLTPVGLSWMERGQFSLYVALCYLWLMLAVVTGKKRYACIAALFGFAKWTDFTFAFVVSLVYILNGRSWPEFRKRLVVPVVFGITILPLFFAFYREGLSFLKAISAQELTFEPMGISLTRILPRSVEKFIPLMLVVSGLLERFSNKRDVSYLLPFFAGSAILLTTYPTFAFDYSVPCLMAFVPFMVFWARLPGISRRLGTVGQGLFFLFLLLVSYSTKIFFDSETVIVAVYVVVSACLAIASFWGDMACHMESFDPGGVRL